MLFYFCTAAIFLLLLHNVTVAGFAVPYALSVVFFTVGDDIIFSCNVVHSL